MGEEPLQNTYINPRPPPDLLVNVNFKVGYCSVLQLNKLISNVFHSLTIL